MMLWRWHGDGDDGDGESDAGTYFDPVAVAVAYPVDYYGVGDWLG